MKVRALETGFYLGRRRAGDVFEVPDNLKIGKWLERVEAPAAAEPKKEKAAKKDKPGDADALL